ncbi:helix-turn-helix domain-containing protein [Chryseobacterium nematophagum]|uniref:helix-turn-helix domain-containing protein n=1 Tax=Chryseobacterium nematophagum TaxID=2305228 RepID=UPI0037447413
MSFKLNVVKEIESGELSTVGACRRYGIQSRSTVVSWLRKFGNFDWEYQKTQYLKFIIRIVVQKYHI